ncbi:MAG: hypothetical protein JO300_08925 [Silvibacterium sp.]|nr:hypothetical protein [Silvibacterium sp.]MBV8436442.1 hypothetical protein [Silvibacterium sp.]
MKLMQLPRQIEARMPDSINEVHWTRAVAATSLIASAYLLVTGRRKSALAVAAGGAAVALLEKPEVVRDLWKGMPGYLHSAKDMLVRVEEFVEDLAAKGDKLRKTLTES